MDDRLDERMFGAIIRSMLDIARNSENHTWFLEKENFASGEFTANDWQRFLGDVAWMASQHPALHIESVIEVPAPDWRDADDYVAAFYGDFLYLFDEEPREVPDNEEPPYAPWWSQKHRHAPFFLTLPFPLTLICIRKRP